MAKPKKARTARGPSASADKTTPERNDSGPGPGPGSGERPPYRSPAAAPAGENAGDRFVPLALISAALLLLPFFDAGPLAFVPPVLRWCLCAGPVLGLWLHLGRQSGRVKLSPRAQDLAMEATGLALAYGCWFLLKLVGLHPSGTDDNIYFYMAVRMNQGAVPYRDFFFAHPPVHLLVPALVFKLFGFSIGVAKMIPVFAEAVAGLLLYLAVRPASRPMAFCALLFHLFAYEVLMGSTDMDGENIMTCFLVAGFFFAARGKPLAAGALAGLALGTGLYALAGVMALGIAAGFTSRRALARYGLGLLSTFGSLMVLFRVLGGPGFTQGVISYHLAKQVAEGSEHIPVFESPNPFSMLYAVVHNLFVYLGESQFKKSLYYHAQGYLAALTGLVLLVLERARSTAPLPAPVATGSRKTAEKSGTPVVKPRLRPRWIEALDRIFGGMMDGSAEGTARLGALATILFFFQWASLNETYDFYSVPQMAVMSLPAAYALHRFYRGLIEARDASGLVVPVVIGLVFGLNAEVSKGMTGSIWPSEIRRRGQVVSYAWRDPWVLAGMAQWTRKIFFVDHRYQGEFEPPYRMYIWNKSNAFSTAQDVADYVRANTRPDETITGASTLAPLVALLAGRRISHDEADTNNKRFRTGILTDRSFFDLACRDNVRYVLSAPRSHFNDVMMNPDPTVREFFTRDRVFDEPAMSHDRVTQLVLYRRRDVEGLPQGMVCEGR